MKYTPLVLLILASCKTVDIPTQPVPTEWHTVEVPLTVTIDTLSSKPLLDRFIHSMGTIGNTLVMVEQRSIWVKKINQPPVLLKVDRADADWFGGICELNNGIVISIGSYPEDRRLAESQTPRGGFVGGPVPLGWLHLTGEHLDVRMIDTLKFSYGTDVPPEIQSCQPTEAGVYIGYYGGLARVDLERLEAVMIDHDLELAYNREAILIEPDQRWVFIDEGGLGSAHLEQILPDTTISHWILQLSHHDLYPDGIVRYQNELYTSSLAGIVKMEVDLKRFTHYQLSSNPTEMRVYRVRSQADHLWGTREDGWVQIYPASSRAILYRLEEGFSSNVYDVVEIGDSLVIATDGGARIAKKRSNSFPVTMPEPIGGMQALYNRIAYPQEARRNRIQGRVVVSFTVDKSGRATNPRVISGIGGGCDEVAVKAIMLSRFKPALDNQGNAIPAYMEVPILFRLPN